MDKHDLMKQVRDDIVACTACNLCKTRINPVIGKGSHNAKVLFIGEAPGETEDKTAIPFCGTSGKKLDSLLSSAKIDVNDIYICNVIKCRPPQNRDPNDKEKNACLSFLTRQIDIIKPSMVVCLGKQSAETILRIFGVMDGISSMASVRGKIFEPGEDFKKVSLMIGDVGNAALKIMVTYHPAALLYNNSLLPNAQKDFQEIKKYI